MLTGVKPNPIKNKAEVGLYMSRSGRLIVMLSDMSGRIVRKQLVQVPKGYSTYILKDLEGLSPGMYLIAAAFEGYVMTHRFVK